MEAEQNKKQEYLKFFDEIFGTDTEKYIDLKKVPLLSKVYDRILDDILKMNKKCEKLWKQSNKASEKLCKTLTREQKKLFEDFLEIDTELQIETEEQIFMFGYIIAKELDRESKIQRQS